jgi:hypothetical protein
MKHFIHIILYDLQGNSDRATGMRFAQHDIYREISNFKSLLTFEFLIGVKNLAEMNNNNKIMVIPTNFIGRKKTQTYFPATNLNTEASKEILD